MTATSIDTLVRMGRLEEALAILDEMRQSEPETRQFTIRKAAVLRQNGRPDEGAALIGAELESAPDHPGLGIELAHCLRVMGNWEKSLAVIESILSRHPNHRQAKLARIDSLIAAGELDEAHAAAETAQLEHPDHLPVTIKTAAVLRHLGRPTEGAALLERALAAAPEAPQLQVELARCLRLGGDVRRSLALAEDTLRLHPDNRQAAGARIEALLALGDQAALVSEIERILEQVSDLSDDPGRRGVEAETLARILPKLPPQSARGPLSRSAEVLAAAAPMLRPEILWSLYGAAEEVGLGSRYKPILANLMERERLPLEVCCSIAEAMHRLGHRRWEDLADGLVDRLPRQDRWHFRLRCTELSRGAAEALRSRREGHVPAGPDRSLMIARLLVRAGRSGQAARYLRLVRRRWPSDPGLFRDQLAALIDTGQIDALRRLARYEASSRPAFRVASARALLAVGDRDAAIAIFPGIDRSISRVRFSRALLRHHLVRGETEAAGSLIDRVRSELPHRSAVQFGPSIDGSASLELRLWGGRDPEPADAATFLPAAGALLRRWIAEAPAVAAGSTPDLPRKVMQYWDKPRPPEDIASLMAGWRNAPGISYVRFDRRGALQWLAANLGPEWQSALRGARSAAEQSDFFRLSWLMLEGGLYVDCDDRLTGDLGSVFDRHRGLTLFIEPIGTIGNNIILAPPRHPVIVWAAHAARKALLERHNENIWIKTGPGLLTRAVAWYLADLAPQEPDLTILPDHALGAWVQKHVALPYKRTRRHWNAAPGGYMAGFLEVAESALSRRPSPAP